MSRRQSRLNRVRSPQALRRGAALYVAVTGTTMIVSVLALSSIAVVRIEREQAMAVNARQVARSHARSGVELALQQINSDPSWRSNHTNGVETTVLSLGNASAGSISWSVQDEDDDLENSDSALRIKGIGRVGNTVQVSSVEISAEKTGELRRYDLQPLDLFPGDVSLRSNRWWGQYFKPNPPPGANFWRISRVEIRAKKVSGGQFYVRLYRAGADLRPSGAVLDSISVDSSPYSTVMQLRTINFSGSTWFSMDDGVCLTFETGLSNPIDISRNGVSVNEQNSALLERDSVWRTPDDDKSLHFRVHGVYTTSAGVDAVPGTWDWDVP